MLLHFIVFSPFRIATIHFEGKVWSVQKNWQQLFVKSINTIKTRPSLSSLSLMLLMLKWSFIWLQSVHIPYYTINENWKPSFMKLISLFQTLIFWGLCQFWIERFCFWHARNNIIKLVIMFFQFGSLHGTRLSNSVMDFLLPFLIDT